MYIERFDEVKVEYSSLFGAIFLDYNFILIFHSPLYM